MPVYVISVLYIGVITLSVYLYISRCNHFKFFLVQFVPIEKVSSRADVAEVLCSLILVNIKLWKISVRIDTFSRNGFSILKRNIRY